MKLKRIAIIVAAVATASMGFVWIVGAMLPEEHQASVTVELPATNLEVWQLVRDLESSATWRNGITEVKPLTDRAAPTYAESGEFGVLHYQVESEQAPSRLVMRIVDNKDFGGTWTYEISETDASGITRLTVTEDGEVYSPIFRFFGRFVFGYSGTLEAYARDIEAKVSGGRD